jgi:hypothetical protein
MGTALTLSSSQLTSLNGFPNQSANLPNEHTSQATQTPPARTTPTAPFTISPVEAKTDSPPDIFASRPEANTTAPTAMATPIADVGFSSTFAQANAADSGIAAETSPFPAASQIESISPPSSPDLQIEKIPLPSVDEMEQELNESGLLLPELHTGPAFREQETDTTPLAKLQPGYRAPKEEFFTPVVQHSSLNRSSVPTSVGQNSFVAQSTPGLYTETPDTTTIWQRIPFEWVFIVILGAQLLIALAQVTYFSLHQYATIEAMVISGNIPATSVQNAAAKAFAIAASAAVGFFFGLAGIIYRNDRRKILIAVGCVMLIITNAYVQNVLALPELISGHPMVLYKIWMSK